MKRFFRIGWWRFCRAFGHLWEHGIDDKGWNLTCANCGLRVDHRRHR